MSTPVRDLDLTLDRSRFRPLIERLRGELATVGIRLQPRFYLSTEYGCIVRSATIGLLWTDGFPDAQRLARRHGLRTRAPEHILDTLRHEVGHAFCYVHRLYRSAAFRRVFEVRGRFFETYPDVWRPTAADRKRFARGELINLYASRHADEDFAVCFQTWLRHQARRRSSWRRALSGRAAILAKLELVDAWVDRLGATVPPHEEPELDEPVTAVSSTVAEWLSRVRNGDNYNLLADSVVA